MPVDTPGMYIKDGRIFKVVLSKAGRPYALELVGVKGEDSDPWNYDSARGMVKKLSAYDMMTLEQAKEYGCLHGVCCVCGARLTNPVSIEAGIGPICAKGEQFADPGAIKVYQSDEYRQAAIDREEAQKTAAPPVAAEPEVPARVLDAGSNKFGPLFLLSWSYNDDDFTQIKNTFKAFEWNLIHQKWDGSIKAWSASLTPDTVPVIVAFAKQFSFVLTPAAEAAIAAHAPGFDPEADAAPATPTTFAQLAAMVS